jgi:hypothetical protein
MFHWVKLPFVEADFTSALKMETACFPETLVSTDKSAWRLELKGHHQNRQSGENLRSHIPYSVHPSVVQSGVEVYC